MRGSILGASVRRAEDPRFVTGHGSYLDNRVVDGCLWAVMVRSTVPHAVLTGIDVAEAAGMPGVVAVFTAADLDVGPMPIAATGAAEETRRPVIAADRVRFVGEVVAVVVAESRVAGVDAAEAVWPEYDALPAMASPVAALGEGAALLFPDTDSNVVLEGGDDGTGDVLAEADVVVEAQIENQRLAAVPLEPNNALAVPREDGGIDVWLGTQSVHGARNTLARALGIDRDLLHVRVPDMGGGFGAKINPYPEQILTIAAARRLGRAVRWQEDRSENLLAMSHGRAQHHTVALGARSDGTITGMRWRVTQDAGAYPLFGSYLPSFTRRMASGPYLIPAIDFRWRSVATNTTPVDAYRGAGRPEATFTLERVMDMLAARLGLDPAEVRRRNLIPPEAFPHVTATGERYDTGQYEAALDLATKIAGYDELRTEQERRRDASSRHQLGIGVATYVEVTAPGGRKDWGRVEVAGDEIHVFSGALSHGHSHETTFSQIAAAVLGAPVDSVRFFQGDTDLVASGGGTMGSRSLQMAGSAVMRSSQTVLDKARRIVAHLSEAAPEDVVVLGDGTIGVAGVPGSGRTIFDIARLAGDPSNLPDGEEPGLGAEDRYTQEEATVPFGAHVSVVEVDTETGDVRVLRHIACDDCGLIVNRMVVDGQVHGGVAQGMAQALWERVVYDEDANPLTPNLTTYALPTAVVVPALEVDHTQTTTDQNPLGAKGIGEAGTIGSTPAVANAVLDALRPMGVDHLDMPLTPARIWEALRR